MRNEWLKWATSAHRPYHSLVLIVQGSDEPQSEFFARVHRRVEHVRREPTTIDRFVIAGGSQWTAPSLFERADLVRELLTSSAPSSVPPIVLAAGSTARVLPTATSLREAPLAPELSAAIADFSAMIDGRSLMTADPLGLGGLLMDACRIAQLEALAVAGDTLLETLLVAALGGVAHYAEHARPRQAASDRLAFRELGLAIGLHGLELIPEQMRRGHRSGSKRLHAVLHAFADYAPLASTIEAFWLDPEQRRSASWNEHRDIDDVMLATSLVPEGCLTLTPLDRRVRAAPAAITATAAVRHRWARPPRSPAVCATRGVLRVEDAAEAAPCRNRRRRDRTPPLERASGRFG